MTSDFVPQETATVEVTVMDVNDNTPACTQRLFKFTVQEANDEEVLLGRVSATDADSRSDLSPAGSGRLIYLLENSNLLSILRVDLSNVSSAVICSTTIHIFLQEELKNNK